MADEILRYWIRSNAKTADEARRHVEQLRKIALGIQPFDEVGEVGEFVGKEADWNNYEDESLEAGILIHATRIVRFDDLEVVVEADQAIAFAAWFGEGDAAYFGLAHHPMIYDPDELAISTGLVGWSWEGECVVDFEDANKKYLCIVHTLLQAKLAGLLETWDSRSGPPDSNEVATEFREFNARLRSSFKFIEQEDGSIRFDISGPELERLEDEDGGQA